MDYKCEIPIANKENECLVITYDEISDFYNWFKYKYVVSSYGMYYSSYFHDLFNGFDVNDTMYYCIFLKKYKRKYLKINFGVSKHTDGCLYDIDRIEGYNDSNNKIPLKYTLYSFDEFLENVKLGVINKIIDEKVEMMKQELISELESKKGV